MKLPKLLPPSGTKVAVIENQRQQQKADLPQIYADNTDSKEEVNFGNYGNYGNFGDLVFCQSPNDFFCHCVGPFGNLLGGLVLNWMRDVNRIEAGTAKGAGLSAGGRNELSRGDGDSRNAKVL